MVPLAVWRDGQYSAGRNDVLRDVEAALDRDADALLTVLGETTRPGEVPQYIRISTSWGAFWPRRWRRIRLDLPSGTRNDLSSGSRSIPARRLPALAAALRHPREQTGRPGWRLLVSTTVCHAVVDLTRLSQHQRPILARAQS